MRLVPTLTFAALATLASGSSADERDGLYKCRGSDVVPIYQDEPCAQGRELRNLATDPANVSVIPFARAAAPALPAKPGRGEKPPKPGGKAAKPKPLVDAAERRHVKDGMTEGEVLAKLGPPDLQAGKGGRKMRWTYLPVAGDAQTVTLVRFEDGRVTAVERTILR